MKKPIELMIDAVPMTEVVGSVKQNGLPHVTHEGILDIGGVRIKVLQLSNGERVIPEEDLDRLFPGWKNMIGNPP